MNDPQIDIQALRQFERDRMGVGFGTWAADDDLHPVADGVDKTAVAGGQRDGEEVGVPGLAKGEGVALGMGGDATAEVAVQGFLLCQIDTGGLTVEADPADAAFLAEDGAANLVVAVAAGGGGGISQAQGQLDPFVLHDYSRATCRR